MIKATFQLPNGAQVSIEGSQGEVKELLSFYSDRNPQQSQKIPPKPIKSKVAASKKDVVSGAEQSKVDITEIINLVKNCDESERFEKQILDRTSFVDRTLLPLYVVHEYLGNALGLTSGEINKITTDLGIPISISNISTTLSGSASRYVVGDRVRKSGVPVHYKLSRRGLQYMKTVISGEGDGK